MSSSTRTTSSRSGRVGGRVRGNNAPANQIAKINWASAR
jgi:hypothetical protein